MKITILRENEIRECVGMNKEAVDAVTLGFTRLVEGKVSLPPIIRVDEPQDVDHGFARCWPRAGPTPNKTCARCCTGRPRSMSISNQSARTR